MRFVWFTLALIALVSVLRWGVEPTAIAIMAMLVAFVLVWVGAATLTGPDLHVGTLAGHEFVVGPIPPAAGVYLVGADTDDDGYIDRLKIGFGGSMRDRVATFQTGSPVELYDVGFWPTEDYETLENELHQMFASDRLTMRGSKREWIDADVDLLNELDAMGANLKT